MKKNFTLLVIALLLYVGPGWATVYYSNLPRTEDGEVLDSDALTLTNWEDANGNNPDQFSNPADEFHISSGDPMLASGKWTVAGIVILEAGSSFDANGFDHNMTIDMLEGASYTLSTTYTSLKFRNVDPSSEVHLLGTVNTFTIRNLIYPTLYIEGSGTPTVSGFTVKGDLFIKGSRTLNLVTAATAKTIQVNQNVFIESATIRLVQTGAGAGTLNINGDLNIIGGSLTALFTSGTGQATINVGGSYNQWGGTFIGSQATSTSALIPNINISGDFNVLGGTFTGAAATSAVDVNYKISGSFNYGGGTYTGKSSQTGLASIFLNGTGSISSIIMSTTSANQKVTIAGTYGLQTDFTVGNIFTLTSGNLSLNGRNLTLNNAFNIISGTLTGDNGAGITFGTASIGANLPAVTLGSLNINRAGQTINLTGNVSVATTLGLSAGTLSIGANTLTLSGAITGSGNLSGGTTSNLIANGSTGTSLSLPTLTLNNFTINRTGGVNLAGPLGVNGTLFLTIGQIDNTSNNITLANNSTVSRNEGTLATAPLFAGKVNLIYTGSTAIRSGDEMPLDNIALNNLTVSKTGGTGLTLNNDIAVNGIFAITSSGKLDGGVQKLNIKGNWINDGTFTANQSTVNFAGTTIISGSSPVSFNNVALASGASLTVPSSTTIITGDFTVTSPSTFKHNNGTVTYAGTGTQNIGGINYYNLTSSNTGARILNGTIGIANTFTPGTNSYTTTGSTIDFNGTIQSINAFSYNNLSLSNSGTKTPVGATLTVNDLTISGAAVLAGNGKTINVAGNWSNYSEAAFSETGSKVVFNGTTPQSITTTGGEIFNNLTVNNNASTVSLNSLATVNGILALTNGILASAGNLTVDLNTGSVAYNAGDAGTVTGNIKVKKAINSIKTHYLACPLSGTTANDFADNTPITEPGKPGTRLYEYLDGAWSPIYDMNTALAPFKAYSVYFTGTTTLDFTGGYSHGSVPAPMTFPNSTSEFRMIGNPFPSTIDWESNGWTKNNLNSAIYYWNAATSKYASYIDKNTPGTNGGTQYISALQGFFVSTTGSGGSSSISLTNAVRATSPNPSIWRTSVKEQPLLKLTAQNGSFSDETIIRFTEDASDSFDGNLDALKLRNGGSNPNLSSVTKGKSYSINSLPPNYIDSTIPLKLEAGVTGTYLISIDQFTGFDTTDIIIEDKLLNISHDLKSSNGYSVALTKGDTTSRLFIKFRKADVVTGLNDNIEGKIAVNAIGKTVNVYFSNITEKDASIVFLNVIGQEVDRAENVSISQGVYTKDLNVSSGIYIVKVKAGNKIFTEKILINN